jgi:putative PIN family toxin of toxin-antitoxin system
LKYSRKPGEKYKLVIDANVIISSIFGGYPEKVIEIAIFHETFAPFILKKELHKFVEKVEHKQDFPYLKEFFDYILNKIKLINVENVENISRDRADDFYIAVAIQEKVDFLITGDKDILSCSNTHKWHFKIVSPKEFIDIISKS